MSTQVTMDKLAAMIAGEVKKAVDGLAAEQKSNAAQLMIPAQPKAPAKKGANFGRIVQALGMAKGIPILAAQYVSAQNWEHKDAISKALGSSTGAAGGFLVPEEYSADVIELLRNASVFMSAGPRVVPLSGAMTLPKITAGASGSYIGENTNIRKEQQSFGNLRMTAKKLSSLVPVSNDLIRNAAVDAESMVVADIVAGLATTADAAMLRDQGDSAAPKGIRYWAAAGNVIASAGTSVANVEADVRELILALENNNSPMLKPTWFGAPRTAQFLADLRDANGNYIYPTMRDGNMLRGYPFRKTNNIPRNLGGGTETELMLVDMAQVVVGEELGIEISVSDQAAYHDGANVVAAFSQDQTVIRAITLHDMVVRHDTSIGVKTGITWGA